MPERETRRLDPPEADPSVTEHHTTDPAVDDRIADRRVGDEHVGEHHVTDRRVGDEYVTDRRVGDEYVADRRVGDDHVTDRRVGDEYADDRHGIVPPPPADGSPLADDERDLVLVERDRLERLEHREGEVEIVRRRAFSLGQLITLVIGGLLIALGVVALIRTGIETPLDQPVEDVLGWDHTPWLGIAEVGAGVLLVLASLRPGGRWLAAIVGLAMIAGGIVMASEADWTIDNLAAEQGFGWLTAVAGAIVVVAALITPRRHQRVRGEVIERV